jgi:hypothetical protein
VYTTAQLKQLVQEKDAILLRIAVMLDQYLLPSPKLIEEAQEHCQHGIGRRLLILHECLEYFFSEIPPDTMKERSRRDSERANIHLHAFLINITGIVDNMAWLWAHQIDLGNRVDLEKKKVMVGLFNREFSVYLPERLRLLIARYSAWYSFMVHHRHPTAHRIPPYVIPYTNDDETDPADSRDYTPRYIHSFSSKFGPVPLHPQSLADANTVLSLLEALLAEIRAAPES